MDESKEVKTESNAKKTADSSENDNSDSGRSSKDKSPDKSKSNRKSFKKAEILISENEMLMEMQLNPSTQHYGLIVSLLFRPVLVGMLCSFFGGYLLSTSWALLGLLLIVVSPISWVACTSLNNRYSLFGKNEHRYENESTPRLPSFIDSQAEILRDCDIDFDKPETESLAQLESEKPILPESNSHKLLQQVDEEQCDWKPLWMNQKQDGWLTPDDFTKLHQLLPWCYAEPEVESTDWLNLIIASIWKRMNVYLSEQLDETYGPDRSLNSILGEGNRFAQLKITCASLGT
jgi:hypothetical protein